MCERKWDSGVNSALSQLPKLEEQNCTSGKTYGWRLEKRFGCSSLLLTKVHALGGFQVNWFMLHGWYHRSEIDRLIWKIYCGIHSRAVERRYTLHLGLKQEAGREGGRKIMNGHEYTDYIPSSFSLQPAAMYFKLILDSQTSLMEWNNCGLCILFCSKF